MSQFQEHRNYYVKPKPCSKQGFDNNLHQMLKGKVQRTYAAQWLNGKLLVISIGYAIECPQVQNTRFLFDQHLFLYIREKKRKKNGINLCLVCISQNHRITNVRKDLQDIPPFPAKLLVLTTFLKTTLKYWVVANVFWLLKRFFLLCYWELLSTFGLYRG